MKSFKRRHLIQPVLVIKSIKVGENHRLVTLFSKEIGVFRAMAYGAGKATSLLKPATIPFADIVAYLYYNPTKEYFRITDVEIVNLHPCIRSNLAKFFTASLWVEIGLISHGGGTDLIRMHNLLIRAIRVLDKISSKKVEILSIQILWRFLLILGMYPDFSICYNCRAEIKLQDDLFLSIYSGVWCIKCIKNQSGNLSTDMVKLNYNFRNILVMSERSNFLNTLEFDGVVVKDLRRLLQQLIQQYLGASLKSIKCAAGFL